MSILLHLSVTYTLICFSSSFLLRQCVPCSVIGSEMNSISTLLISLLCFSKLLYNTVVDVSNLFDENASLLISGRYVPLKDASYVPTTKGSMLLVHEGYAFRLKNKLAYGKKQWYCTGRPKLGCTVDVTTAVHRNGSVIKRVRNTHNHQPPGFYRRKDGSYKIV